MSPLGEPGGSVVVRASAHGRPDSASDILLSVGDLVGRHASCALQLDHPGAPLVAACVVRRGRRLFLEGQGERPELGEDRLKRVRLVVGQTVEVAGTRLVVQDVNRPQRVLAVAVAHHPPQELVAPYYALRGGRRPDLLPGEIPDPDAVLMSTGVGWRISVGGRPFDPLVAGRVWQVAGTSLRTSWVDTRSRSTSHVSYEPVVLEARTGSPHVRISRRTRHRVTLRGRPARLLRAVVEGKGVLRPDVVGSRAALESAMADLEDALRAHGLRSDLIRPDGLGGYELFLHASDRVVHIAQRETG